jgi:tetratricopeptide (TPR) repeat protein
LISLLYYAKKNSNLDKQLSLILLLLGHYYFYKFNFHKASYYLNEAKNILDIICKQEKKGEEKRKFLSYFNNSLHYLGRIYFAQYDFVKAAHFYIQAQHNLDLENVNFDDTKISSTGFYHLRLGQVLEASQLIQSADYHYQQSYNMFMESGAISGLIQVSLIRANLIGSHVDDVNMDNKLILEKKVKQIKDAGENAKNIGYKRGYLEALLRLFLLYLKYGKILNVVKVLFVILTSSELYKLISPKIFVSKLKLAIGLYSMGPYYIQELLNQKNRKKITILKACPCPCNECKKLDQQKLSDKLRLI